MMTTANQKAPYSFFLVLIGLYFAQGLPSGILAKALPPLMRDYGVSLSLIGALKLLAIPWFLKFLWAPLIDSKANRRFWIFSMQGMVIPLLLVLALFPLDALMQQWLWLFLIILLLINTCSATQDIATDGLAASSLHEDQLGIANTIQVAAYKMGLILGGSAVLIFIDDIGWQLSMVLLAGLLCIALSPIMIQKNVGKGSSLHSSLNNTTETSEADRKQHKSAILSYFKQDNIIWWILILMTCKISDALGSSMLSPMLVDKGMELSDIGYLNSIISVVGLIGAAVGGLIFLRWHSKGLLVLVCFLQALSIFFFGLIAKMPEINLSLVYAVSGFEQFIDGVSTVIIFAFMMKQCRQNLEGTDYTLQNSIHIIGMGLASLASGFIAEHLGYETLFTTALVIGSASLYFISRWELPTSQRAMSESQQ